MIQHDSDEIDILDLLKIVFKWKIVVFLSMLIAIIGVSLWLIVKPDTYSANAEIAIGKIAGYPIDGGSEIELFLETKDECKNIKYNYKIISDTSNSYSQKKSTAGFGESISVRIKLQVTGDKKDTVNKGLSSLLKQIMHRQEDIFRSTRNVVFGNQKSPMVRVQADPRFLMKSFTYPSVIVSTQYADGHVEKKPMQKVVVFTLAGLFFGICLAFVFEFGFNIYRRYKEIK